MGAGSSSIREASAGPSPELASATGLGDLPGGCAASVLVNLEPRDMCRLAGLNRAFRGASLTDFVWESKLPSNYQALIEKVFDGFPDGLCRTDVLVGLRKILSMLESEDASVRIHAVKVVANLAAEVTGWYKGGSGFMKDKYNYT